MKKRNKRRLIKFSSVLILNILHRRTHRDNSPYREQLETNGKPLICFERSGFVVTEDVQMPPTQETGELLFVRNEETIKGKRRIRAKCEESLF